MNREHDLERPLRCAAGAFGSNRRKEGYHNPAAKDSQRRGLSTPEEANGDAAALARTGIGPELRLRKQVIYRRPKGNA